jgi:hypothetical protein
MFAKEEFYYSPNSKILILLSYVETKTQVMASMLSPHPKIRNSFRYNPIVIIFLDDEALKR